MLEGLIMIAIVSIIVLVSWYVISRYVDRWARNRLRHSAGKARPFICKEKVDA